MLLLQVYLSICISTKYVVSVPYVIFTKYSPWVNNIKDENNTADQKMAAQNDVSKYHIATVFYLEGVYVTDRHMYFPFCTMHTVKSWFIIFLNVLLISNLFLHLPYFLLWQHTYTILLNSSIYFYLSQALNRNNILKVSLCNELLILY